MDQVVGIARVLTVQRRNCTGLRVARPLEYELPCGAHCLRRACCKNQRANDGTIVRINEASRHSEVELQDIWKHKQSVRDLPGNLQLWLEIALCIILVLSAVVLDSEHPDPWQRDRLRRMLQNKEVLQHTRPWLECQVGQQSAVDNVQPDGLHRLQAQLAEL